MVPSVSIGKRRLHADAIDRATPTSKKARVAMEDIWDVSESSPVFHVEAGHCVQRLPDWPPNLRDGVHAVTNSVTSDDPLPDMLATTAETCVSSESEQDGCVEGVGERNPSQIEELRWLKLRLRKLMAQQAKLVQRRTALRKVWHRLPTLMGMQSFLQRIQTHCIILVPCHASRHRGATVVQIF